MEPPAARVRFSGIIDQINKTKKFNVKFLDDSCVSVVFLVEFAATAAAQQSVSWVTPVRLNKDTISRTHDYVAINNKSSNAGVVIVKIWFSGKKWERCRDSLVNKVLGGGEGFLNSFLSLNLSRGSSHLECTQRTSNSFDEKHSDSFARK